MGQPWPQFNTWFLWPTRVHIPNGISIGSAVFAGSLLWQTETVRPRYLCHVLHKYSWTDQDAVWVMYSGGPKEACPGSLCKGVIFRGKDTPINTQWHSAMSCAKTATLIKMTFGSWTRVRWRNHVLHGGTLAPPGEYDWTIRVRVDAALCQTTLTTCYY